VLLLPLQAHAALACALSMTAAAFLPSAPRCNTTTHSVLLLPLQDLVALACALSMTAVASPPLAQHCNTTSYSASLLLLLLLLLCRLSPLWHVLCR
jgi:hypothetical protein